MSRHAALLTLTWACAPAAPIDPRPPEPAPSGPPAPTAAPPLPTAEPVAPAPEPAPPPLPVKPAPPSEFAGAKLVFHVATGEWTNQIVIAPWGDVIAIGGHQAKVLARDSGKELMSIPICFTQSVDAAQFVDDKTMYIACGEVVQEVIFPGGGVNEAFKLPVKMEATAVGSGFVAAAIDGFWSDGKTQVTLYQLPRFSVVDQFDASAEVEAVAIAPGGKWVAAATNGGGIDLRDSKAKKTTRLLATSDRRHSMVRFDPSGRRLFADTASFQVGEIDLASGKVVRSFESGSWGRAVRYRGDDVLMTGSDGLVLLATGSVIESPNDDLGEGLDLSADKSFFCAAGRGGEVACFSTRDVAPSTFGQDELVSPIDDESR